jgi:uncharacterized phage-like protein YoqJ
MSYFMIAVTGHRPPKIGGYTPTAPKRLWIRDQLRSTLHQIQQELPRRFQVRGITGMALGVDQDFALICQDLGIPYDAYIPGSQGEQTSKWSWNKHALQLYANLIAGAQNTINVPNISNYIQTLQARNEAMVNAADLLLAVWDGSSGGTYNCIRYAEKSSRPIHIINPNDFHSD